jgi:translation initiation factor 2 subunit 3
MVCFGDAKPVRTVSFIDSPGHETLMATVLSGAALMDGAILVIAANEPCPQPQTSEHLKALDILGIRAIVIVQNKIDLVSEEDAIKNYEQIVEFTKGSVAEGAPIIPISALHNANIDALIDAIQERIPTPKRDLESPPKFYAARSFDINKPGTRPEELKGGVIGGSLRQGVLRVGDEIEILPGIKVKERWTSLRSKIVEIYQAGHAVAEAYPGGLVAIQTELDPSLTRGDKLAGCLIGLPSKMIQPTSEIDFEYNLFDHVIGVEGQQPVPPLRPNDVLMITAGVAKSVGIVKKASTNRANMTLKIPICAQDGEKIAIAKQVGGRWHLIGWGTII